MAAELKHERGRMIFTKPLVRELSPFANHTGSRYSFPICSDILERIRKCYPSVVVDPAILHVVEAEERLDQKLLEARNDESEIPGYEDLFPHQASGARWAVIREKCIIADQQGTGKTVTSLAAAALSGKKNLLIVCSTAKFADWEEHAKEWYWQDGTEKFQITTYKSFEKAEGYDIIIFDEAHKLRNRKSESLFKTIRSACRKVKYVFFLTGTPNVNEAGDMWTLLDMCDPKRFNSYWGFVYRFCLIMESAYGVTVGGINFAELENYKKLIYDRYMIARESEEVYDVEEIEISIEMSSTHREFYNQYVKEKMVMSDVGTLLKAAVNPESVDPDDRCLYTKYDHLVELVETKDQAEYSRFIIFVKHIDVADEAKRLLESSEFRVEAIHSEVSKKRINGYIADFQKGEVNALVITYGIGGEGLNLTAANKMILFEFPWTYAALSQGKARFLRIGQKQKNLKIFSMVVKDTIEEHVLNIISNKQDISLENLGMTENRTK